MLYNGVYKYKLYIKESIFLYYHYKSQLPLDTLLENTNIKELVNGDLK